MTKECFNCQKEITKPEEGICPHCGVKFDLKFDEHYAIQKQIDTAANYKREGKYDKSIKIYEVINDSFPNNPIIYKSWAKTLISSGNYDLSLEYFVKAIKLFQFFDCKDHNCEKFVDLLMNEPRNSKEFLLFLKQISGNEKYEVASNSVNDHIDVAKNFNEKKKVIIEHLRKNKGNIIVTGCLNDYKKKHGENSITSGICDDSGNEELKRGEMEIAKSFFLHGSAFGLTSKMSCYNSPRDLVCIGDCLTMLITKYTLNDNARDIITKATALAYIYLSRVIEKKPNFTQYAYVYRANLFQNHKNQEVVRDLISNFSLTSFVEPFIISDYYMAASDKKSVFVDLLSEAKYLHEYLEDITVAGKDADEYSLEDMAKIGEGRHVLLFKILEQKYKNGDYDITMQELESIFDTKLIEEKFMKNFCEKCFKEIKINKDHQEWCPYYNSSSETLGDFLENDYILKGLELNAEKKEALKTILNLNHKNTLITARAGTGKSTLLCSLIYILIKKYNINKNKILLLSFNRPVMEKNDKDLKDKFSIHDFFGVHTFDRLANQIVKTPGKVLDILSGQRLTDTIADIIKKQSLAYRLKYWWYLSELDKEYKIDAKIHVSLLGEDLKSYGEKSIANFLFENGLDYEYEPVIRWNENQYRPDFLVTQSNRRVIIEYFGFTDREYLQQAQRKREYWGGRRNDYQFIEMSIGDFRGERNNPGEFLGTLKQKLEGVGLTLRALSENEKAEEIFKNKISLRKISDVALKFIDFAQAQCITPNDISNRLEDENYTRVLARKDKFFSEFANSVYAEFIKCLNEQGLYNFSKVMKSAVGIILKTKGECSMNLGPNRDIKVKIKDMEWVLIDEFQDYSPAYHELISAIKRVNPNVKFVCVGDDWQAVNGFAGSDTKYMSDYEKNFSDEDVKKVNLPTNLRSKKNIVDAGNNLMDGLGIKAIAENKDDTACVWIRSMPIGRRADSSKIQIYLEAVRAIISEHPNEKITILHRNNKIFGLDLKYFKEWLRVNNNIKISTIHKYKGEENDIIIFVNVTNFNHPMMHPDRSRHYILGLTDKKIIDEERRLFYVAMTRAKKAIHVVTDTEDRSPFINDLMYRQ